MTKLTPRPNQRLAKPAPAKALTSEGNQKPLTKPAKAKDFNFTAEPVLNRVKNSYRVPKRQWNKWNANAQMTFNSLFHFSMNNPKMMRHPAMKHILSPHWETIAWNHAWIAADCVMERYWGKTGEEGVTAPPLPDTIDKDVVGKIKE